MTTPPAACIMVVEDDRKISNLLVDYLRADGFEALAVYDGPEALRQMEKQTPALLILDLMLPGLGGLAVCKAVRVHSDIPILMLTARVDEIDRLLGFDAGADDYVCKPFAPREVVARVRALLRRSEGRAQVRTVPWLVDEASFRVGWNGKWLPLTRIEFFMLRLLLSRPGWGFSRTQLMDCIHDRPRDISDRAIDTHIKNIRRKIEAAEPGRECIASIYGVGYRLDMGSV
jgi:two-component system response regulator BaeR